MEKSATVKKEKTESLKWKQIQPNDLLQTVNDQLNGQHYIHLYSQNTLNIYGEFIAPNSLCLIDCMKQINILKDAKMNTGMLYIRSMQNINFNGKIYNENGECFIGANNKLHLQRDGDICLLFLKYWSNNTQIDCTITADNLTVEQLDQRLKKLNENINNFSNIKQNDFELKELCRKLKQADERHKRSTREISDTIDKTGLNEQNIRLFLEQLNKIRDCVMKQPQSLTRMNQKLSTFVTLMQREFNTELSIESYFEFQNLMKYANALKKKGYTKLKQLECNDEKDNEYQQILSICQKVNGFNRRDQREIKAICLKSESWKRYQNEKNKVITKQMSETAPLLKDCFGSMDDAMKKIQNATKNALQSSKKRSLVLINSKSPTNLLHKTAEESLKAICKFKENKCKEYKGEKVIKLKALTVATGISDCCSEIIKNQQDVASSILLTKSILLLKPDKLKKKEENQSLEMRVKERVGNAIKNAWKPYIEQQNKLKSSNKHRKTQVKQIMLDNKEEKKQNVVHVMHDSEIPICYIQTIGINQTIGKTMDDEILKISVNLNKKPSKKATYYIFERAKRKNECLGVINIKKNKIIYEAHIDLIEFVEDSDNETDEYDIVEKANSKRLIAVYKDSKKRKMISNCVELVLPEIHEYISKNILKTVSISTIKAIKGRDSKISVFWQCPPKVNVFGTITVGYKVNYIDKNHNQREQRIYKLPLILSNNNIPISMQIITIISTDTEIIKSKPIHFIISSPLQKRMVSIKTEKKLTVNNQKTKPKLIIKKKDPKPQAKLSKNNQKTKPKLNSTSNKQLIKQKASFVYKPSNHTGIYGAYQIESVINKKRLRQKHVYRASFSSGIYGSYLFPKCFVSEEKQSEKCEIIRKENECLDLLYTYLTKNERKNIDHVKKLKIWIKEKKFNSKKICRDIAKPKMSQLKLFHPEIFKKIVKFTESKTWKTKQKEIMLISSAKLWNVVDDGVINIWSSDLVTIEIAMEYFKFFGKFQKSFHKLVELNPPQSAVEAVKNKAKNFMKSMVSKIVTISDEVNDKIDINRNNEILRQLECVANNIKDFELIQKIFHSTINELEHFAVKCIRECIKEAPNSERFKYAQKQREKYRIEYEKLQKCYNQKEKQLNDQYDKWIELKLKLQARKTAAEYEQKQKQNQK